MIASAMYSLSSCSIPLWLPKKNDCRMIILKSGVPRYLTVDPYRGWLLNVLTVLDWCVAFVWPEIWTSKKI
jgi:hypothetical protein